MKISLTELFKLGAHFKLNWHTVYLNIEDGSSDRSSMWDGDTAVFEKSLGDFQWYCAADTVVELNPEGVGALTVFPGDIHSNSDPESAILAVKVEVPLTAEILTMKSIGIIK